MRILFYLFLGGGIGFVLYLAGGQLPEGWYEQYRLVGLVTLLFIGGYVLYWLNKRR